MCCRTLLDPAAREVLKPTLLDLCRQSFKQLLDKEKAALAKQASRLASLTRARSGGVAGFPLHSCGLVCAGWLCFRQRSRESSCLQETVSFRENMVALFAPRNMGAGN